MIGWPPLRRWLVARRLRRHAQVESGAPPPELLRRLRADIPQRPPVGLAPGGDPEALALPRREVLPLAEDHLPANHPGGSRRGAARRPWLVAASLAAAVTAVVLGMRVRENLARSPAALREPPAGFAGSVASWRGAKHDAMRPAAGHAAPEAASPTPLGRQSSPASPATPAPRSITAPAQPSLAGPAASSAAGPVPAGGAGRAAVPPPRAAAPPPIVDRLADGLPGGVPGSSAPSTESDGPVASAPESAPAAGAAAGGPSERGRQLPVKPADSDQARRSAERRPALAKARAESSQAAAPQPIGAPAPQPIDASAGRPTGAPAGPGAALPGAPMAAEEPAAAASQWSAPAARAGAPPAPLRSSFGGSTGIAFYPRLWQELVTEGRLPPPASVRVDELANAFELSGEAAAVSRPRWTVEGAPLPPAGASYLLRFAARGLAGRPGAAVVQVEFDPAVVASARRVGANADRNGASALFLVELRPPAAASGSCRSCPGASRADVAANAGAASAGRAAGGDRVIGTLRVSPRTGAFGPELPARRVRLSELTPSWVSASPALRVQGLAVQLAEVLAVQTSAPRLRLLREQARSLAAELPAEPKAAALLQLVERAAELAGVPDAAPPP